MKVPVSVMVGSNYAEIGEIDFASSTPTGQQIAALLREAATAYMKVVVKEVEPPEGYYFKGHLTPGFGLISLGLYKERKYLWGKRVSSSLVLLDNYNSGAEAANAAKVMVLENWESQKQFRKNADEARENL
ncbi:hypothetical protein ACFC1L_39775 [Streptomyces sp. NPDC056210]|uniref:hypothetical protein n=1 Tax=Streptomyces sp. NPDC056210 TaxID=3345746 RepID=UPI0035E08F17